MYAAVIADAGVMDLLRYPLFIVGADALQMRTLGARGAVVHRSCATIMTSSDCYQVVKWELCCWKESW